MTKIPLLNNKYHPHYETPEQWLGYLADKRGVENIGIITAAMRLYDDPTGPDMTKGVAIADILLGLGLDNETLSAAIAYPALKNNDLHIDTITGVLGESVSKLLRDFMQMQSLGKMKYIGKRGEHYVENLRKMLLAIVTDTRAVFIVLASRLCSLREAKSLSPEAQIALAQETMDVHAPLANRLGIWQLKWETEDLCLRYLKPDIYSKIAKELSMRRVEREEYVKRMVQLLTTALDQHHIKNSEVTGRVKHIYSIYKKMERKSYTLDKIYDITAMRVMVPTVDDCYAVLSVLQSMWQHVPEEFDDYISKPKSNGYRSIHTILHGPDDYFVEVQIRTHQMHAESELGVAAHWRYKEGVMQPASYEEKIILLRQIMAWQQEVVTNGEERTDQMAPDLFAHQIYVFTPMGDIIDLPVGSTSLDFAYHIHSDVGHRCRGAKVNGVMVPLTQPLQTGSRIEILTAKEAHPSRDWLNPHAGYLKSSRARAKVAHWFRVNDHEQHADDHAKPVTKPVPPPRPKKFVKPLPVDESDLSPIQILGMNDLLTTVARCCHPKAGDSVVGYITRARGITVHHQDCKNLCYITRGKSDRLIDVVWEKKLKIK